MSDTAARISRPPRVAFILPSMVAGGAEKITLSLIEQFLADGCEVDLVLANGGGQLLAEVPAAARIEQLEAGRIRHAIGKLRDYFRRREPDAAIVSLWPLTAAAVLARRGLERKPRLVLCEHNNLEAQYGTDTMAGRMMRAGLRWISPRAEARIGVSQGIVDLMARLGRWRDTRGTVVHNPIPAPERLEFPAQETDPLWQGRTGPRLITLGSLKPQKNHALMLEAFARFHAEHGGVLAILGEGVLRSELEARRAELGLEQAVLMPGHVSDTAPWYASADLFVLSSHYEGLPTVILEAMHFGLPIVSTDCVSGPDEILQGGKLGRLVPMGDAEALAAAMAAELAAPHDPAALRARAAEFSPERAFRAYRELALGTGVE